MLVGAVLSSSACYAYTAVPLSQPLKEERAEFRLSDEGRAQMRYQLGPGAVSVEGRVVQENESSWTLQVYRLTNVGGMVSTWSGEVVELPRDAVELVSRRDFDRQRSVWAAAGVAGTAVLFIVSRNLLGGGTFPRDGGTDPPGEAIRY